MRDYYAFGPECQLTGPKSTAVAPLVLVPVEDTPSERIGMDLVRPLEKCTNGHLHLLVIVDYETWYPEAIPCHTTNTVAVAMDLMKVFVMVGVPKNIETDQGMNFTHNC